MEIHNFSLWISYLVPLQIGLGLTWYMVRKHSMGMLDAIFGIGASIIPIFNVVFIIAFLMRESNRKPL